MKYNEKWVWGTTRFFPHELTNMMQVVLVCLAVLLFIAIFCPGIFIPIEEPADPANTPEHIKPEWYFIASYQALKEFKTISIGENFDISGEIQGIIFQILILLAILSVPLWERGKRPPSAPGKPNKIAMIFAILAIIFLIMGIISNLRQDSGVQGIILHILAILSFATMPYWGGIGGRSVRKKTPLFLGAMIIIIEFIYLTIKGLLV